MEQQNRSYYNCSVDGCLNSTLNGELSFFKLPVASERRTEWLRLIHREDLIDSSCFHVRGCEAHFSPDCVIVNSRRKLLKRNSIPQLLPLPNNFANKGIQAIIETADLNKLEYKLHRKIKVFNTTNLNQLKQDKYNLVASSPQHGVVFVASTDGLLAVYRVAELLYTKADPWCVTITLPEEPTLTSVNCDGELLAVVGNEKSILIYNVKDFRNRDASPKLSVPRSSSYFACDMQWSPTMSETLAIGFHDKITILNVGTGCRNDNSNNSGIRYLNWHPSGSSLVVGHADGTLCVYSLHLSLEKRIPEPAPPLFDGASLGVRAVHWMANNQFAVVYNHRDTTQGSQSAFTLINAPEGDLPPRAEYVGLLESDADFPCYRLLQIKPWNVMLCWPTMKAVIKLLPPESDGGDSQAPVQLLSELLCQDDLYSVGVALDRSPVLRLSSQSHLQEPTDETITLLHVLTQTGDLATYIVGERPSTPTHRKDPYEITIEHVETRSLDPAAYTVSERPSPPSVDTESSRAILCLEEAAVEPPLINSYDPHKITFAYGKTRSLDPAAYTVSERPSPSSVDTESSRAIMCLEEAAVEPPLINSYDPHKIYFLREETRSLDPAAYTVGERPSTSSVDTESSRAIMCLEPEAVELPLINSYEEAVECAAPAAAPEGGAQACAARRLVGTALARLSRLAHAEDPHPAPAEEQSPGGAPASFCGPCAALVGPAERARHQRSLPHRGAVFAEQELEKLVREYVDEQDLALLGPPAASQADDSIVELSYAAGWYRCALCALRVPRGARCVHERGRRHGACAALAHAAARCAAARLRRPGRRCGARHDHRRLHTLLQLYRGRRDQDHASDEPDGAESPRVNNVH